MHRIVIVYSKELEIKLGSAPAEPENLILY